MCTLAHVFEGLGFATVVLASIREQAERMFAPRTLFCDFPLGRPLGRPSDAAFQTRVLHAGLSLLECENGPVFVDYPEILADEGSEQISCALPPRFNPAELAAVDEATAIRGAYERTVSANRGHTNFGRVLTLEQVPEVLRALDRIASGTPWKEAGLPADPAQISIDLRTYYCEAAVSLPGSTVDPTGSGWALERWFLERTEGGKVLMRAREAMKEAGASFGVWFYMAPLDQTTPAPPAS